MSPHYRKLFDERFIGSYDFEGKASVTVEIAGISVEELRDNSGTAVNKPVLTFKGAKKGLVLNKTVAKTIAELYGNNTDKWIGKKIVMFATTCQAFGETVECVRVQNKEPK